MIGIDLSVLVVVLCLAVFVFVMDKILYQPLDAIANRRKYQVEKANQETMAANEKTRLIDQDTRNQLHDANEKIETRKTMLVDAEKLKTRTCLEKKSDELAEKIQQHKASLDSQSAAIKSELSKETKAFSDIALKKIIPIILIASFLTIPVLASSPLPHEEASTPIAISETAKTVNFCLMIAILVYLAGKPIKKAFSERSASIRNLLNTSENKKKEALDNLKSVQDQNQNLSEEISGIKNQGIEAMTLIRQNCLQERHFQEQQLENQCDDHLEILTKLTQLELTDYLSMEVIQLSEKKLSEGIDVETDSKLIKICLDQMESLLVTPGE